MNPARIKLLLVIVSCILVLAIEAQDVAIFKDLKLKTQMLKGLLFTTEGPATFSLNDLEIIDRWNFESYRKDDSRLKIQLIKGPLIVLLSKKEMAYNTSHSDSTYVTPRIASETNLYEIILELNIGLGYQQKQHTEVLH